MKLPKRVTACDAGWSGRYPLPEGVQSRLVSR